MRKISVIFLFIFSFQSGYSQVWVDSGAKWHYEFWAPFMSGYVELNYDRDTLIDGISCQVIESTLYKFYDGGGFAGASSWPIEITYVSGDTVFYRENENFFVLFDFGAEIGDSWVVSDQPSDEFPDCDDISTIQVTGNGVTEIDGAYYRYLDLEPTENSPYGFKGRFVERFGLVSSGLERFRYLFPNEYECSGIPDDFPTEFGYFGFVCFEDDSFTLYNPTSNSCTKSVGLIENNLSAQVACFPNPATNSLNISANSTIVFINIYTSTGNLVITKTVAEDSLELDVSMLKPGMYFFDIGLQDGSIEKRNIVIN